MLSLNVCSTCVTDKMMDEIKETDGEKLVDWKGREKIKLSRQSGVKKKLNGRA